LILITIFVEVQNFDKEMGKRRKPIQFNDKRLYYSIQEVADHFAVNVSLLRFWEKEFDNIRPKKTAGEHANIPAKTSSRLRLCIIWSRRRG